MRRLAFNIWNALRTRSRTAHRPVTRRPVVEGLEDRCVPSANLTNVVSVLRGTLYIDVNGNNRPDTGEPLLPGVAVSLTGTTYLGTSITTGTVTDVNGQYQFLRVPRGTYRLGFGNVPGFLGSSATVGNDTMVNGSVIISGIPVSAGAAGLTDNVGYHDLAPAFLSLRDFLSNSNGAVFPPLANATPGAGLAVATGPTLTSALRDLTLAKGSDNKPIDVSGNFIAPDITTNNTIVRFDTSAGPIFAELFDRQAPRTVANFLNYVQSHRYDSTIFHRLVSGFVIQGGGFKFSTDATGGQLNALKQDVAVKNEPGISNTIGTIAMAKLDASGSSDPVNSATDQFFFNLGNNASNLDNQNGGFTVFGKILGPTDQKVINSLTAVPARAETLGTDTKTFGQVPLQNYKDHDAKFATNTRVGNYDFLKDVVVVQRNEALTYSVSSSNPSVLTASVGSATSLTGNGSERITIHGVKDGTATITVTATDQFGSTVSTTFKVTITDHAPTATVALSPSKPAPSATLTATATKADVDSGETVTLTYVWKVNGTVVQTHSSNILLTDMLDLSKVPNLHPTDTVTVTVTPNDGLLDGTPVTASTTINQPPVESSVTLAPGSPTRTQTLTATAATPTDPDGDTVKLTYVWQVNGTTVKTTSLSSSLTDTLNLNTISTLKTGDHVTVTVTPNDGKVDGAAVTASATVGNSPPVESSLTLAPSSPNPADTLTATAGTPTDPDGDPVKLTYVWQVNGTTVKTTSLTSSLTDTLDLSKLATAPQPGDHVTVTVTPNDGTVDGAPVTASATVNSPPVVNTLTLSPSSPTTTDMVMATATTSDANSDPVKLTYVWQVNGTTVKTTSLTSSLTDTLDLSTLSLNPGDTLTVTATPNDGKINGAPKMASATLVP